MSRWPFVIGALAPVLALLAGQVAQGGEPAIAADHLEFFETKVRPILVESCYGCHSFEKGKAKGDLRLDTRDALRKGGATGAAIVAGDPEKSLLIQAVRHATDDLQMPPKEEGGKLSAERIAVLEHWVRLGAPDPRTGGKPHPLDLAVARRHWTLQPVAQPAVPAVRNTAWVRSPVDAFVLAGLEAKDLAPAPPADARTLLRRVTYDLTGLPPTPEETDAFVRDPSPAAYAKVVERLLASPRYGERWGRFWLDVARFADTKGYLAGNVERRYPFSHTYRDYVIRAFNEDKPYDRFIVEQLAADRLPLGEDKSTLAALGFITLGRRFLGNQNDVIDDRIDVVTRGLMGLTVTCARCHDHKFDPISMQDYYGLHGVFASTEEPAEKPLLGPLVDSPAYQEFLTKTAAAEAKVKERARSEVETFLAGLRARTGDYLLGAHDAAALPKTEKLDLFAGPRKLNVEVLKRWQAFLAAPERRQDPLLAPWFAFAALPAADFAAKAAELVAGWSTGAASSGPAARPLITAFVGAPAPITSLKDVASIYNAVASEEPKTSAGGKKAKAAKATPGPAAANVEVSAADRAAVRAWLVADGAPPNLGFDAAAALIKRQIDDRTSALKRDVEALQWTEPGAPARAMAVVDKAAPANSRVFLRGNPANRGPEAPRQFLAVLSPEPRQPFREGSGRLELAKAIADPRNPLTARVWVNRVWGWHFGSALVRTPSDFGVRTEEPVQRALLDWLAASFVEGGWSVKQLHRAIVLSSTYRQASEGTARAEEMDPDNALLHRFNRRRLEFEALRDTLLAASGTLDLRAGGLPDDLTREPFTTRRTVYGFIDRQNLPGMFRTFDFPNPDTSSAQRFATTVPQQALFLLNSPFSQAQARRLLARPDVAAAKGDEAKVRALYRVVHQRPPDDDELALARDFVARPAAPDDAPPAVEAGWQHGYGSYDALRQRVGSFQRLTERQGERLLPGKRFPDSAFGYLSLTATGGHPGASAKLAAIRRWTAGVAGTIRIEASLGHASPAGDGVRGLLVSSVRGLLGEWRAKDTKVATRFESVPVVAGETLDFVIEPGADANSDSFTWAPTITLAGAGERPARTWSAKADFDSPARTVPPLTRWEEFAQVLLLSNELAFVD